MKILTMEQGSEEWLRARLGIPTASAYDKVITPKKLTLSSQAGGYRNRLLAEWFVNHPIDWGDASGFMDRGKQMEAEARAAYEFMTDTEVELVGFVQRDDGLTGGSPDGLVGELGGVDFKCLALHNHIGLLMGDDIGYKAQVQGYMYLTDREWWEVVGYCPGLPLAINRVERDDAFIKALDRVLNQFIAWLDEGREKLAAHRNVERAA